MNVTNDNVFRDIKKQDLDDCYICLSNISNKPEFSAVFLFKCRHPICYECLNDIISKYTDDYLKKKCYVVFADPVPIDIYSITDNYKKYPIRKPSQ